MEPTFVTIPYSRFVPYPVAQAYAWLTDYQDDDPDRTTAVVKRRPVVERHPDRVVLDGELEMFGKRGVGRVEVRLHPPDHWIAEIVQGSGRGSVYEYRLSPVPGGARLDVRYRIRVRRWGPRIRLVLARPLVRRELHTMWEGFAASMAKDLDPQPVAPPA